MTIRFFGPSSGSSRSFDADALLWKAAVLANGGSVSYDQIERVSRLNYALKDAGVWSLADDYWLRRSESLIQSLTSLKQRVLGTAVNSPTFVVSDCIAYDGSTNYIDDNWIPSARAVAMTGTDMSVGVWLTTDVAGGSQTGVKGCRLSTNGTSIIIRPKSSGNLGTGQINGAAVATTSTITSIGWSTLARIDSNNVLFRKNGVAVDGNIASVANSTALPNITLFEGCFNGAATPSGFVAGRVAFSKVGARLTDAQALGEYNAINTYVSSF